MLIQITNGVSFSLVAGACCYIDMSKPFYAPKADTNVGAWTMNINSTGAKYYKGKLHKIVLSDWSYDGGSSIKSNTYTSYYSSDTTYGYRPMNTGQFIFLYDGTYYVVITTNGATTDRWSYNDYGDT